MIIMIMMKMQSVPSWLELKLAQAKKPRAGLVQLGSETRSKSKLSSARTPKKLDLLAELGSGSGQVNILSLTKLDPFGSNRI